VYEIAATAITDLFSRNVSILEAMENYGRQKRQPNASGAILKNERQVYCPEIDSDLKDTQKLNFFKERPVNAT
jgi:hypothetical protein